MIIDILRLETVPEEPTRGVILINNNAFCVSMELPWKNNKVSQSCIPIGVYNAKKYPSPTYGPTLMLDVVGRSYILFHQGNRMRDTKGCVIMAQHFTRMVGEQAIGNSRVIFKKFQRILKRTPDDEKFVVRVNKIDYRHHA